MSLAKKLYIWSCPLPLILLFALSLYIRKYDGWGAWAAAPMLLPAVLLSLIILVTGLGFIVHSRKSQERSGRLIIATLVAGALFIFLLLRAILMEIERSFF